MMIRNHRKTKIQPETVFIGIELFQIGGGVSSVHKMLTKIHVMPMEGSKPQLNKAISKLWISLLKE